MQGVSQIKSLFNDLCHFRTHGGRYNEAVANADFIVHYHLLFYAVIFYS